MGGLAGLDANRRDLRRQGRRKFVECDRLPELITSTPQAYEDLAIELATNPEKLAAIKRKLAKQSSHNTLFDTELFTRHIEAAYTAMYEIDAIRQAYRRNHIIHVRRYSSISSAMRTLFVTVDPAFPPTSGAELRSWQNVKAASELGPVLLLSIGRPGPASRCLELRLDILPEWMLPKFGAAIST